MKKCFIFLVLVFMLVGCTASLQTATKTVYCPTSNKIYDGILMSEKNRVGTELQFMGLVDENGKIVAQTSGSGRGFVAGMTDGAFSAALHAGGLMGAAALLRPDEQTYSGGSSGSASEGGSGGDANATGGKSTAFGGKAVATGGKASASASAKASSKSWSKSNGKGWIPPGQNDK